jgi:hypothetical protein
VSEPAETALWFDRGSGPRIRTQANRLKFRKATFMTVSAGAIAPTLRTYDHEAFDDLADQADSASSAFELDAIDRGLDRLVAHPNRKTSGKLLARRLVGDAKKHLRATRGSEYLSDDIQKQDDTFDPPTESDLNEVRRAVDVIRIALFKLRNRDLLILATRAAGGAADAFAVKARQFRNLVTAARERLWAMPGIAHACEVVMEALGRWRFETIELLAPLSVALSLTN